MDTAHWPQEIVVKAMEEIIVPNPINIISENNMKISSAAAAAPSSTSSERKVRPQKDQALKCPRCNSTNTKFCYYNNYSLSQPRYFCKTCKRYWTEGGSLRNIPVGGGSRKNKKPSFSSSSFPSKISTHNLMISNNPKIPNLHHGHSQGQDLNLGFGPNSQNHDPFRSFSEFIQLPTTENLNPRKTQFPDSAASSDVTNTTASANASLSALELLNGLSSSRGLAPFMTIPVPVPGTDHHHPSGVYSSGFPLGDFKPTLNFSLDGYGGSQGGGVQQEDTSNGRMLFPFEDLKQISSNTSIDLDNSTTTTTTANELNREQGNPTGYWTGLLGSGASW